MSSSRANAWRDFNAQWQAKLGKASLTLEDTKYLLQQRLQCRQGTVSDREIQQCVDEYMEEQSNSSNLSQAAIQNEEARLPKYLKKWIVPTYGHIPLTHPDGVERLLCTNLNGLTTSKVRNFKVSQIKTICKEYNIGGTLANEHGLNLSNLKPSETLHALLEIRNTSHSIWTHNKHEKFGQAQQGGCAIVIMDELCQ